jgi:exopolyphosphatase/guanosine-5'-triphosphate,3'-diphosphate pyrophosphatase
MAKPTTLAAVDLGSNSFHLIVARLGPKGLTPLVVKKDRVRLAAGLGPDGVLSAEAQERALESLSGMRSLLAEHRPDAVRAVGTSTLRKAQNALPFLVRAYAALGHRIDVITGRDEARLIYEGVAAELNPETWRLVVDIGGGSTEVVLGRGRAALRCESVDVGCVSWSMRHFGDGVITAARLDAASREARALFAPVRERFASGTFTEVLGSSGTIRAIARVLRRRSPSRDSVTPSGLRWIRDSLAAGVAPRQLDGVSESRAAVFAGGVATLTAVFEELGLDELRPSDNALREGVLRRLWAEREAQDAGPPPRSARLSA